MACATALSSETGNWSASFPVEANSLRTSSMFMKKLMAVAVSNITYMRSMFPDGAYGVRKLGDLDLKILSESSTCDGARQIINWVKGCFEALDYKYLRQMMLGIHDKEGDHDNVIEAYVFHFRYENGFSITCNGVEVNNFTEYDMQMTRKATAALLRTLVIIMQTLEPLPKNYYVTMKLLYYDDVTPLDYEPRGFVPAKTDTFNFKGVPLTIKVGHVSTPFHSIKLNIKADKKEFEFPNEEPMPSGSIQLQSSGRTADSINISPGGSDNLDVTVNGKDPADGAEAESSVLHPSMENSADAEKEVEEGNGMRCPCGYHKEDGLMISCQKCEYWQHSVCFGVLKEDDAPEIHLCDICYTSDCGFEPKDRGFYELSPGARQALCLWRHALLCVYESKITQAATLAKRLETQRPVAVNIIKRMEDEGYIITPGIGKNKGRRSVNRSLIMSHGIPKYVLGTTKEISQGKDREVEELNKATNNLHITSEATTYRTFGHGKEKYEVNVNAEDPQLVEVSEHSVLSEQRGKKRASQILKDYKTCDAKESGYGEKRPKRVKASTSKHGISLQCDTNE